MAGRQKFDVQSPAQMAKELAKLTNLPVICKENDSGRQESLVQARNCDK